MFLYVVGGSPGKGFPIHKPVQELNKEQESVLQKWIGDFFKMVEENLYKIQYRVMQARYRGRTKYPTCRGHTPAARCRVCESQRRRYCCPYATFQSAT